MAKNLLVGDSITYERKIREVIVASRIEKAISKQEILEIYLNSIYLGRSSWGVDLAARAYFGKPIKDVTLAEGAFLAGLTKGPAYFNPDQLPRPRPGAPRLRADPHEGRRRHHRRADDRSAGRARLNFAAFARARRDTGFHLVDEVGREARAVAGIGSLTAQSYEVRSTIRPDLQRATEAALQEGLAQYEQSAGRVEFRGARGQPERRDPQARSRSQGRPQQAGLAHRAGAARPAALRRALDAGGRGREAKLPRRRRI